MSQIDERPVASSLDNTILCTDPNGELVPIPAESIQSRSAFYGLMIENQKILLQLHPKTGRLHPPGGIAEDFQPPQQALRQLIRSTTGLSARVNDLILLDEAYRYEAPNGYRLTLFFYGIERQHKRAFIDFDSPFKPQWVPLREIERDQIQFGYAAIRQAAEIHHLA